MSARGYWGLTALWFVAVGLAWGVYFQVQSDKEQYRANERAHAQQTLAQLMAIQSEAAPRALPVDRAQIMGHVRALAFPRATDEARKKARKYASHALLAAGYRTDLLSFQSGINVVAERPGTDPNAGVIVVGAHFDTVPESPGADDNASGVAGVLEVARLLAKPTKRGLRIVLFDREEDGLLGSQAYLRSPERRAGIQGAIILEMIGFSCKEPGCQRVAPGTPAGLTPPTGDFLAVVGDLEHPRLMAAFRRAARLKVIALPLPLQAAGLPDARRSDHASFWDHGIGAVMVTDTANLRNPHYHLASDTPDTLDPVFFEQAVQTVVDATDALLSAPTLRSSR